MKLKRENFPAANSRLKFYLKDTYRVYSAGRMQLIFLVLLKLEVTKIKRISLEV